MKITLTITASAAALARVLNVIAEDDGEEYVVAAAPVHAPVAAAPVITNETFGGVPLPVFPQQTAPVMPEVVAAAPTVAGEPEFDSTGLPWDERIHSKQKGQTNDGKWRKQRGVDENYYKAVEAELRARYGAHVAPEIAAPVMPVAAAPVMPVAAAPVMPVAAAPVMPQPIPMPVAPMPEPEPEVETGNAVTPITFTNDAATAHGAVVADSAANEPVTFHTIMTHVGAAMGAGSMTPDYLVQLVGEINQQCGTAMQSFTDMAAHPNAIQYCWAAFARDGKL